MNLIPLANHLEASGLGIVGQDIFVNMLPVNCPNGILLRNPQVGAEIDYKLPGYYKTHFRLIARAESHKQGEAMIEAATRALTMQDQQVGSMFFRYMRARTQPVPFPISVGNLIEFVVDMSVVYME